MKNLSAALVEFKNRVDSDDPCLLLLEITLTDSTVYRLARNTEDIVYDGETYNAFSFEVDPIKQASQGEIQTINAKVSNVTQLMEEDIDRLNGGVGSKVVLTAIAWDVSLDQLIGVPEDYIDLAMELDVLACVPDNRWITFTLGAPSPLREPFPPEKYVALHCRYPFNDIIDQKGFRCGYTAKTIDDISLIDTDPVLIKITDHNWNDIDSIKFNAVDGTVGLNGNTYLITKVDADWFSLNGTDSSDFIPWGMSAGVAGFGACNRTFDDCRDRDNSGRGGFCYGLRTGNIRIA